MVLLTTAPDSARKVSPGAVFSEDVPAEEASARDVDVETDLTETGARCSGGDATTSTMASRKRARPSSSSLPLETPGVRHAWWGRDRDRVVDDDGGGGGADDAARAILDPLPLPFSAARTMGGKLASNARARCKLCDGEQSRDDMALLSGCNHALCVDCVEGWATRRARNCPICKVAFDGWYHGGDGGDGARGEDGGENGENGENGGKARERRFHKLPPLPEGGVVARTPARSSRALTFDLADAKKPRRRGALFSSEPETETETRREKSLRIGVHHADAVVWEPVTEPETETEGTEDGEDEDEMREALRMEASAAKKERSRVGSARENDARVDA